MKVLYACSVYADNSLSAYSVQSKFCLQTINLHPAQKKFCADNFLPLNFFHRRKKILTNIFFRPHFSFPKLFAPNFFFYITTFFHTEKFPLNIFHNKKLFPQQFCFASQSQMIEAECICICICRQLFIHIYTLEGKQLSAYTLPTDKKISAYTLYADKANVSILKLDLVTLCTGSVCIPNRKLHIKIRIQ